MDMTKRPFRIPPGFSFYAEKNNLFELYKQLIEQLIIHRPDDPLQFLIEMLQRGDTLDVPRIIMLGPPASGKRTLCKMIANKLRCIHLTVENLLNDASPTVKNAFQNVLKSNVPISTEMWLSIIKDRVSRYDCLRRGWIMEGFPQTRQEALALQELGICPKHCNVYHTIFDWPSSKEIQARLREVAGYSEEEMVHKLTAFHRHKDGVVRCYASTVKVINADQPKIDTLSQVVTFLRRQPRSNAPIGPRIILLGPTASGKATQASLLALKYNLVNVSCGQLIKQAIVRETDEGLAAKPYVGKDMIMPDSVVLAILKDRLCQHDCCTRGWVLTGYPRTREQAEQLGKAGLSPNRVFVLEITDDSLLERLTLRGTDPIAGERYHMLYNPPGSQEVKDRLARHPKDEPDAVGRRLAQYHLYTEEMSDCYTDAQRINADQDPHTVFECLESMTVNPIPKRY